MVGESSAREVGSDQKQTKAVAEAQVGTRAARPQGKTSTPLPLPFQPDLPSNTQPTHPPTCSSSALLRAGGDATDPPALLALLRPVPISPSVGLTWRRSIVICRPDDDRDNSAFSSRSRCCQQMRALLICQKKKKKKKKKKASDISSKEAISTRVRPR